MSQRPDIAKTLGSIGCLMWLIPIVVVLAVLFIAIAVHGGATGIGVALVLIGLAALLIARARRSG